jgi:hypothetical protein
MDARQWSGDDDRDLSDPPVCDVCALELYPEERPHERCRRCRADAYGVAFDEAGSSKDAA